MIGTATNVSIDSVVGCSKKSVVPQCINVLRVNLRFGVRSQQSRSEIVHLESFTNRATHASPSEIDDRNRYKRFHRLRRGLLQEIRRAPTP